MAYGTVGEDQAFGWGNGGHGWMSVSQAYRCHSDLGVTPTDLDVSTPPEFPAPPEAQSTPLATTVVSDSGRRPGGLGGVCIKIEDDGEGGLGDSEWSSFSG